MGDRGKKSQRVKHSESLKTLATTMDMSAERRSGEPSQSKELMVPRHCTLDGFAEEALANDGVDVAELDSLTLLQVQTQNTLYQVTLLDPLTSQVLIRGGSFFVVPTIATLSGSSFGGSFLKSRWVGIGMRMEICGDGRNIVTSPVCSVRIEGDSALPGPF